MHMTTTADTYEVQKQKGLDMILKNFVNYLCGIR